jgi:hypothetical protein
MDSSQIQQKHTIQTCNLPIVTMMNIGIPILPLVNLTKSISAKALQSGH